MCERVQTSTRVFFHLTWSFISPSAAFKNPGLGRGRVPVTLGQEVDPLGYARMGLFGPSRSIIYLNRRRRFFLRRAGRR
jgi:hypothetical protein